MKIRGKWRILQATNTRIKMIMINVICLGRYGYVGGGGSGVVVYVSIAVIIKSFRGLINVPMEDSYVKN